MKRHWFVWGVFGFFILLPVLAFSAEFQPVGFESLSMGGAGVASAK
ncbi:MAG: hypothetical protein J7M03_03280 [Candidatus Desulfofervidaceae bacterium]|nr:hypothetical protein [Candidatus Desulfofervidaceae bacterium]MDL1970451.1 hypothetical protein [Candidatus Desulfofervidaceae bacterium]